jgi:hypothetical protein
MDKADRPGHGAPFGTASIKGLEPLTGIVGDPGGTRRTLFIFAAKWRGSAARDKRVWTAIGKMRIHRSSWSWPVRHFGDAGGGATRTARSLSSAPSFGALSALLLKLVDQLFVRPSISIGLAGDLLEVTPASASANLRKLVDAEILVEVSGRKRDQRFVAREIIRVAHGD